MGVNPVINTIDIRVHDRSLGGYTYFPPAWRPVDLVISDLNFFSSGIYTDEDFKLMVF